MIYRLLYSFGPYEGDYEFIIEDDRDILDKQFRIDSVNYLYNKLELDMNDEISVKLLYESSEEFKDSAYLVDSSINDIKSKMSWLISEKDKFIAGENCHEDYTSLSLYKVDVVRL